MNHTFKLSQPSVNRKLNLSDPGPAPADLTEKHRPTTLAEIVGQGAAVYQLETFLDSPHSKVFLFSGPTGVGKTTAALALANELGCGVRLDSDGNFTGLRILKSGTQDQESVLDALRDFRYTPMGGSGWKVLVCDEADMMTPKAAQIWLSALEDLPQRRVIVFTTNHPQKFPIPFIDRCEHITFDADATIHAQDAQTLINHVWMVEIGEIPSIPRLADLKGIEDANGQLSYRRVIRTLEPLVRKATVQPSKPVPSRPTPSQRPRRPALPVGSSYMMSFV